MELRGNHGEGSADHDQAQWHDDRRREPGRREGRGDAEDPSRSQQTGRLARHREHQGSHRPARPRGTRRVPEYTNQGVVTTPRSSSNTCQDSRMSLDPGLLFLSLITSGLGFVLFTYGRKQDRYPQVAAGVALMVYPYFVPSLMANLLIGAGIVGVMWIVIKQGW